VIFRRRLDQPSVVPWPSHGAAFWVGLQIGRVTGYMAGWSRLARASIVIAGMALTIFLFWLDHPGWAVAVGFVVLAVFWLSVSSEASGFETKDVTEERTE
jgi:hypothetical protein